MGRNKTDVQDNIAVNVQINIWWHWPLSESRVSLNLVAGVISLVVSLLKKKERVKIKISA